MSKKEKFLNMVQNLIDIAEEAGKLEEAVTDEGMAYLDALKAAKEKEKPQFTDNGKLILSFMKDNYESTGNTFTAKTIAEGIFLSSRSVSGAIRKLVTDGFVEKIGQDPIVYSLTPLGIEIIVG